MNVDIEILRDMYIYTNIDIEIYIYICRYRDVYRHIMYGRLDVVNGYYSAQPVCYCSRSLFFTEAARLGEAETEARTYR